jgi:anti-anti-sigma factor
VPVRFFDGSIVSSHGSTIAGTAVATVSQLGGAPIGSAVVTVAGEIDEATTPSLSAALTGAIDGHERVCCDLSGVAFFGAAGVNTLLAAHRHAQAAGRIFGVRGAHGTTRRVLEITGGFPLLAPDMGAGACERDEAG